MCKTHSICVALCDWSAYGNALLSAQLSGGTRTHTQKKTTNQHQLYNTFVNTNSFDLLLISYQN